MTLASTRRRLPAPATFAAAALMLLSGTRVSLANDTFPVPTVVIYPGDIIRDTMLTDREVPPNFPGAASAIQDRSGLLGKTARHTLLPGLPVASNAVGEPKVVSLGAMVRVTFAEGGLTISTYASALQAGAVGDVIPVRNMETGLTISGVIEKDGSIRVGNS